MTAQNIVDVISDFYELRKVGKEYQCLCPFHDDRHLGSFSINPVKNIYHCFACGAHGNSIEFLMRHESLSYPDALRWLGRKYGIEVEGSERFTAVKPSKPHKAQPREDDLPILTIPFDYMTHTRGEALKDDTLCNWLRSLPWNVPQRERLENVIKNYGVGHAKDGRVIFWQVDENGAVRTGKLMRYQPNGKRVRTEHPGWIHNLLAKAGKIDLTKSRKCVTLFGMHLLAFFPDAEVCIVESEKTALVCSIAWGNMKRRIWLAAGGLQYLKPEMLQPLITAGRRITLFPDRDGQAKWQDFAQTLGYDRIAINTEFVTKYWKPEDGEKADIADVIVRMLNEYTTPSPAPQQVGEVLRGMAEKNPILNDLIQKFNLKEVK